MVIAKKDDDSVNWWWTKKKERGDRDNDLVPVEKQLNGIEEICNDLLCGRGKKEKEKASIETQTRDAVQ